MLALGKPFERQTPNHILRDLADLGYRKGEPLEKIADSLEATLELRVSELYRLNSRDD